MNISILEGLGLTKGEIKTYLALLELGESTAGPIIEKSALQSSVVHNCLHTLKDKGLVSYIIKGKIRHYQTTDPQNILTFVEEKKRKLEGMLPELLLKQKLAKKRLEARVFEGNRAVMVMLTDMIKDAEPGEQYMFFSASRKHYDKEIQDFFRKYDAKRKEKRIDVRGIAPLKLKKLFEYRFDQRFMNVRYVKFPIPQNLTIFRDMITIFSWEEEFKAVQITSELLANEYKEFFEDMWKKAAP